jgi:hypothetical protein
MRKILPAATLALLALAACDRMATEGNEAEGPLTGTWSYRATGYQYWPYHPEWTCDMETTIIVRQEGNELEGEAQETQAICRNALTGRTDTLWHAGVVRGEVEGGRVHFSNAGNWYSFGEVTPDRVEGYLESYSTTQDGQPMIQKSGSFVLERISHDGFTGPRA